MILNCDSCLLVHLVERRLDDVVHGLGLLQPVTEPRAGLDALDSSDRGLRTTGVDRGAVDVGHACCFGTLRDALLAQDVLGPVSTGRLESVGTLRDVRLERLDRFHQRARPELGLKDVLPHP
jgi:hypothetical protein